jgi:hypothetical protein
MKKNKNLNFMYKFELRSLSSGNTTKIGSQLHNIRANVLGKKWKSNVT